MSRVIEVDVTPDRFEPLHSSRCTFVHLDVAVNDVLRVRELTEDEAKPTGREVLLLVVWCEPNLTGQRPTASVKLLARVAKGNVAALAVGVKT